MSYEKDKIDSFVTSVSLSTALAPYVTSNSLSAAIAGLDLAPYMTSNSISSGVATDVLTVRGAASVSATLSAGAVTVAGRPVGALLIGTATQANAQSVAYSGSWSDFVMLELRMYVRTSGAGINPVSVFTDGGTTPVLTLPLQAAMTSGRNYVCTSTIYGGDGNSIKVIDSLARDSNNTYYTSQSVTANAGYINCLRVSLTATASLVISALYGWRNA
jgi:PhoPQ-activated pathogenicity-related protein